MEQEQAFEPGRWRARWIWSHAPGLERLGPMGAVGGDRPAHWVMLRRSFDLATVPDRAPARMTADSRYVLYVNGVERARGPARGNLRRLRYDTLDLASALRPGRNAIAVLARYFGQANAWWAPIPPAGQLGAGAFVFEMRLGADWLVSDGIWRARQGDAWTDLAAGGVSAIPSECCDARAFDPDWREADFDDSGWPSAMLLRTDAMGFSGDHRPPSHPYGPLLPRGLSMQSSRDCEPRLFMTATVDCSSHPGDSLPFEVAMASAQASDGYRPARMPIRLRGGAGVAEVVLADFGKVVAGSVRLEIDAPAGARIDVAAVEHLDERGRPQPAGEEGGFRYWTRGDRDAWETETLLGFRALVLAIRSPGEVGIRKIEVCERLYPRPEGCDFECSDELLNRVFRAGRRTVDLCSQDAYIDCPTREQRAWSGDAVVHQMVDFATNPDWGLACAQVEMAASPRADGMLPMAVAGDLEYRDRAYIPDFALHWIRMLHNLVRYRGDRERVARCLPVAERILHWFDGFSTRDGLISDVTGWVLIEWSSVSVAGRSSVLNALYARGLRDFAEICEWCGDRGRAGWARRRYQRIARGFELFWDPARSLYVDHAVDGRPCRPVSQHAQATPMAAGLVPAERIGPVVEAMLDEVRLVHAAWQMASGDSRRPREGEGLLRAGFLYDGTPEPWWDVERQIVRAQPFFRYVVHDALARVGREDAIVRSCRDWVALLDRCPTSLSETWYGGTTCHGWSATPTRDLVTRILGVTPAEPGFGRVRVAPRLGDLEWACGTAPTPHGQIRVRVDPEFVEIESPIPIRMDRSAARRGDLDPGLHRLPR